jgi:hypothetical protein
MRWGGEASSGLRTGRNEGRQRSRREDQLEPLAIRRPQSCAVALSQARGWLCNASMRGRQRQSRALRRRGRLRPIICVGARNCHQPGGSGIFFRANA